MVVNEVDFEQEPEDDKPEPLEMEHFYFPLGLWLSGLVISAIFLLAEIIVNHRKQSNGDVPMATQEDPRVAQATPQSDVEQNSEDIVDIRQ